MSKREAKLELLIIVLVTLTALAFCVHQAMK
jgi:hypothetical protein